MLPLTASVRAGACVALLFSSDLLASTTLFRVFRRNYKPDKVLHYNLNLNRDCSIASGPFDVHYRKGQERLELSSTSRNYYEPLNITRHGPGSLTYTFRALEEFSGSGAIVEVFSRIEAGGNCSAMAFTGFQRDIWSLHHFDLNMKMVFGIPTGIDYGIATGRQAFPSPGSAIPYETSGPLVSVCAYGGCPEN